MLFSKYFLKCVVCHSYWTLCCLIAVLYFGRALFTKCFIYQALNMHHKDAREDMDLE